MKDRLMMITIVFFLSIILIGEVFVYTGGVHYDSHAWRDTENNDIIRYSVSSSDTNDYCAVLIDNNGFDRVEKLYIYVDEGYEDRFKQANGDHSLPHMRLPQLAEQIKIGLKNRSFANVEICNSQELITRVERTLSDPSGCGILSLSYALPSEIYEGKPGDKLISWMKNGGCLYWTGSVPGEFCVDSNGILKHIPIGDACELFFNARDCINVWDSGELPLSIPNDFTKSLVMKNDCSEFAVDTTKITSEYIELGTKRGNYVSEILMCYGKGMLVQFSGGHELYQMDDICQTIASGLCYKSEINHWECGKVTRTTVQGHMLSEGPDKKILYTFIGKTYPSYGKAWDV